MNPLPHFLRFCTVPKSSPHSKPVQVRPDWAKLGWAMWQMPPSSLFSHKPKVRFTYWALTQNWSMKEPSEIHHSHMCCKSSLYSRHYILKGLLSLFAAFVLRNIAQWSSARCTSLVSNAFHSDHCSEALDLTTVILTGSWNVCYQVRAEAVRTTARVLCSRPDLFCCTTHTA